MTILCYMHNALCAVN